MNQLEKRNWKKGELYIVGTFTLFVIISIIFVVSAPTGPPSGMEGRIDSYKSEMREEPIQQQHEKGYNQIKKQKLKNKLKQIKKQKKQKKQKYKHEGVGEHLENKKQKNFENERQPDEYESNEEE
eukprot:gene414-6827_t